MSEKLYERMSRELRIVLPPDELKEVDDEFERTAPVG